MKRILVRILAALITFLIGWSCARLNFIHLPRDEGKAVTIVDNNPKEEPVCEARTPVLQPPMPVSSWDGYVKRGKLNVRAGGSTTAVNGVMVSYTVEMYESSDAARHVLRGFKGQWYSSSDVAPSSSSCNFKVLEKEDEVRIAWVAGGDLHYVESFSYPAATALLQSWGMNCK